MCQVFDLNSVRDMVLTLMQVIGEALDDYVKSPRGDWVKKWPGQAVLCASQNYWTTYVHEALREGGDAMQKYLEVNNKQIDQIVFMVRGKLSKQNRTTLQALIVLDVHSRDVLVQLVKEGISSENDFKWLSQMRYYWEVGPPVEGHHAVSYCDIIVPEAFNISSYLSEIPPADL